jgi:O-antigen/teichoic acid export membrane protein
MLYGGAAAISRFSSLLTFPLLTRWYSVEEYGLLDAIIVLANLLALLLVFGQDSAVARYFYEYEDTPVRRQVASQSLAIQLLFLAVLLPGLWVFAEQLAHVYTNRSGLSTLSRVALAQVPFTLVVNFCQNLLKWTFDRARFLLLSIGSTVANVIAIVAGILWLHVGLVGLFWLYLASSILFATLGLMFCRHWLERPRGLEHIRELLWFGIPYGVIAVISAFVPAIDRFLISNRLAPEVLGFYAAGYRVAFLLNLPIQAFQMAWGPFALSIFKQDDARRTYDHILLYFTIFISLCTLALTFVADPLLWFLASSKYMMGAGVVFPLSLGLAIQAIGWILTIGIDLSKKSYFNLYAITPSFVITSVAMLILIKSFGITGVAFGFCIGNASQVLIHTWLAYRAYPLRFSLCKPLVVVGVTFVAGILGAGATNMHPSLAMVLRAAVFASVVTLIWRVVLTQKERTLGLQAYRSLWNQ